MHYKSGAQSSIVLGPQISNGTKSFPTNGKLGLGGSVEYVKQIFKKAGIRFNAGFDGFKQRFPYVDNRTVQDSILVAGFKGYSSGYLPIRIGFEYFIFDGAAFIYSDAGITELVTKYKNPELSKNLFSYAIGTGYRINVLQSHFIQLSLLYNHNDLNKFGNRNYFTLKFGYGFMFKK
jgi:hypothetical protein